MRNSHQRGSAGWYASSSFAKFCPALERPPRRGYILLVCRRFGRTLERQLRHSGRTARYHPPTDDQEIPTRGPRPGQDTCRAIKLAPTFVQAPGHVESILQVGSFPGSACRGVAAFGTSRWASETGGLYSILPVAPCRSGVKVGSGALNKHTGSCPRDECHHYMRTKRSS